MNVIGQFEVEITRNQTRKSWGLNKDSMNYKTIQSKVALRNKDTKQVWNGINRKAY